MIDGYRTGSELEASPVDRGLSAFRPIRRRKAADEVVTAIIDAIRGGVYEPGDLLPRERDLAERLEVSRMTVREAVRVLARAGVVSVRRGNSGGAFVETRSISPEVMAAIEGESHASVRSVLEARRTIELACARLAAQNATEADHADLYRLLKKLDVLLGAPEEFIAVDMQFHLRIGEAAKSVVLHEYLDDVLRRFQALRTQYPVGHIDLRRGIENQLDTFTALCARDDERIRQSLDAHLGEVEEHFLGERLGIGAGA